MSMGRLFSKKGSCLLFIFGTLVFLGLYGAYLNELNAQKERFIYVGRIRGGLGAQRTAFHRWREMTSGDAIGGGQTLRVSQAGSADLSFGDSQIVLGARTRLTSSAAPTGWSFIVREGSLRACVSAADGPLELHSAHGRLRITEGEAVIAVGPKQTSLRMIRGRGTAFHKTNGAGRALNVNENIFWTAQSQTIGPQEKMGTPTEIPEPPEPEEPSVGKLVLCDTLGRQTEPLQIRELRVKVQVNGASALTEIEQTFFNPTPVTAEGVFYFPLPADAAICRLAMYVDGNLMEGELVERSRARQVYEEIVRGRRDPALMEWQEGNVFKTRIFPIPANGPKRILVTYAQALPAVDGRRGYVYPLVSKTTQATLIGRFELNLTVSGVAADEPFFLPSYPEAVVKRDAAGVAVSLERERFHPQRDFVVRWAPEKTDAVKLFCRRNKDEDGHFMLSYQTNP